MPHVQHGASGSFGPVLLTIMLVLTALIYLRGWVLLRSNSLSRIPAWRACSFLVGLFLIWIAVASPLSALDQELLTAHMLKHLLLMTVAPPLIWLGEAVRACSQALLRFLRFPNVSNTLITASIVGSNSSIGVNSLSTCAMRGVDPSPPPASMRNPNAPSARFAASKPMSWIGVSAQSCRHPDSAILNFRGKL